MLENLSKEDQRQNKCVEEKYVFASPLSIQKCQHVLINKRLLTKSRCADHIMNTSEQMVRKCGGGGGEWFFNAYVI